MKSMGSKVEKQSNIELLRILCALGVVAFHMIAQSDSLGEVNQNNFIFSLLFHSMGRINCTIFVIIGAWFLVDKRFDARRILSLWIKTLAVCVAANAIVLISSPEMIDKISTKDFVFQFLPILGHPYWFIQAYILMLFVSPILNIIVNEEKYRGLRRVLLVLSICYVVVSSIPFFYSYSNLSNDFVSFCCIYLITGSLKRLDYSVTHQKWKCLLIGLGNYLVIIMSVIFFDKIKESWEYAWQIRFFYISNYITIFSFMCAFGVFFFFKNLNLKFDPVINFLGKHSFGVYLIHQVPILYSTYSVSDTVWIRKLEMNRYFNSSAFIPYCFFCLIITFIIYMYYWGCDFGLYHKFPDEKQTGRKAGQQAQFDCIRIVKTELVKDKQQTIKEKQHVKL